MKLNNKGFTLVELLAVIVILVTILLIAIPSITSSLERSKTKQLEAKKALIVSAAEIYVSDHKNNFPGDPSDNYGIGYVICISQLVDAGLLLDSEVKDADGNEIEGCAIYLNNVSSQLDTYEFNKYDENSACASKCS